MFATCNNTIGSYTCQCKEGWTENGTLCSGNELFLQTNVHIQNMLQALFLFFVMDIISKLCLLLIVVVNIEYR